MTALGHDGACKGADKKSAPTILADTENGMRDTRWASAHLRYAVIPAVVWQEIQNNVPTETLGHDDASRGADIEIRPTILADTENGMRGTRWASAHLRYAVIPAVVGGNPSGCPTRSVHSGMTVLARGGYRNPPYDLADTENGNYRRAWASAHLRYAVIPAVVGGNPEWMPDAKRALGHDGACKGRI